jgi:hypothetical protein
MYADSSVVFKSSLSFIHPLFFFALELIIVSLHKGVVLKACKNAYFFYLGWKC